MSQAFDLVSTNELSVVFLCIQKFQKIKDKKYAPALACSVVSFDQLNEFFPLFLR